jgi:hypothetical protein
MDDLTIVTCNHNTPELVKNLVKSIRNTCINVPEITVIDTGEIGSGLEMISNVTYWMMLNTSHGVAVNKTFEIIDTKYILLVDSDVLFLKDFSEPFQKFKEGGFALMGEVVGDRGGKSLYPRVNPWFCFMNLEQLKKHNIQFYDFHRTKQMKSDKTYDIGSTMFEDVINAGLTIADVKMEGKYFKHYEGMSWRVQKYNPMNGDTDIDIGGTHDNKALYEYGLMIQEQYKKDTIHL